jgi:hypothetical protein
MNKIINLYDFNTNTYVGQLFLIDVMNKRYNYLSPKNELLGSAITRGNKINIVKGNTDLYTGLINGKKIDFRDTSGNLIIYGII